MRKQGIHQRPIPTAGRWMHHETGLFVDNNEIVVFIDYRQRDFFCFGFRRFRRWNIEPVGLARFDRSGWVGYRPVVTADAAFQNETLQTAPGQARRIRHPGQMPGEPAVKAVSILFLCVGIAGHDFYLKFF